MTRHIRKDSERTVYSRGALPWPVFMDQTQLGEEPPPPAPEPRRIPIIRTKDWVKQERAVLRAVAKGRLPVAAIGHATKMTPTTARSTCLRLCKKGVLSCIQLPGRQEFGLPVDCIPLRPKSGLETLLERKSA